jgi:hypothetical protein
VRIENERRRFRELGIARIVGNAETTVEKEKSIVN